MIGHIDVVCRRCGDKPLTRFDRLPDGEPGLRWRHNQAAPWGGGHREHREAPREWLHTPSDANRRTRSHTTDDGVTLLCHTCGDKANVGTAKWQTACVLIERQGRASVSLAEFRAVVGQVG